jgi:hypothetical protein
MVLVINIKIFQTIFRFLTRWLTNFENHKMHEDYFNSYLWKLFLFEFVNNYSAFFFITVRNSWLKEEECPEGDCLHEAQMQVTMTLCLLTICSLMQVPYELIRLKLKFLYEDWLYRRKYKKEPRARSFIEEQSKFLTIDDTYEVQMMMTQVIALGYTLLFGGVAPLAVVLSTLVFAVQLRACAVLLTTSAQRTFPWKSFGIGNWHSVVWFLMNTGVVYSSFLFVAYGRMFQGATLRTQMTGFVLFMAIIYIAWGLIDIFFPGSSPAASLLQDRRAYLLKAISQLVAKEDMEVVRKDTFAELDSEMGDAVEDEDWDMVGFHHPDALDNICSFRIIH